MLICICFDGICLVLAYIIIIIIIIIIVIIIIISIMFSKIDMYNMEQHGALAVALGGLAVFFKHPFMKTILGYGHLTNAAKGTNKAKFFTSSEVVYGLGISLLSPGLYLLGESKMYVCMYACMYV